MYQQTLANMLADKPDFMIDLGDTTMVDKFGKFFTLRSQYKGTAITTWADRAQHAHFFSLWEITMW